ncbi:hypothetical protein RJ639_031875 [Escallonia herrerae]|uniref:Uncharacterized protein n=1 Tax=Escallonia herrerae TaxID=1293975 RepID=A0AA88X3A7_9ASTE|nr:hypothetical protein RJ639_031875 [Escallonia herrerae]
MGFSFDWTEFEFVAPVVMSADEGQRWPDLAAGDVAMRPVEVKVKRSELILGQPTLALECGKTTTSKSLLMIREAERRHPLWLSLILSVSSGKPPRIKRP